MIKEIIKSSYYQDKISTQLEKMYYDELLKYIENASWEPFSIDENKEYCVTENGDKWYKRKSFILKVESSGRLTVYVLLDDGSMQYLITNSTGFNLYRQRTLDEILNVIK